MVIPEQNWRKKFIENHMQLIWMHIHEYLIYGYQNPALNWWQYKYGQSQYGILTRKYNEKQMVYSVGQFRNPYCIDNLYSLYCLNGVVQFQNMNNYFCIMHSQFWVINSLLPFLFYNWKVIIMKQIITSKLINNLRHLKAVNSLRRQ